MLCVEHWGSGSQRKEDKLRKFINEGCSNTVGIMIIGGNIGNSERNVEIHIGLVFHRAVRTFEFHESLYMINIHLCV